MIVFQIALAKAGEPSEVAEVVEPDPLAVIADDAVRERDEDRVEEGIGDEADEQQHDRQRRARRR